MVCGSSDELELSMWGEKGCFATHKMKVKLEAKTDAGQTGFNLEESICTLCQWYIWSLLKGPGNPNRIVTGVVVSQEGQELEVLKGMAVQCEKEEKSARRCQKWMHILLSIHLCQRWGTLHSPDVFGLHQLQKAWPMVREGGRRCPTSGGPQVPLHCTTG